MRRGRGSEEHRAAIQRRLARLSDELAVFDDAATGEPAEPTHTRIRPAPGSALEEPVVAPEPPWEGVAAEVPPTVSVPVPGRHAARRARPPLGFVGAGGVGVPQVAVLAVVVALGLAVTGWWLLRSGSHPLPAAPATAPALVTPVADGATAVAGGGGPGAGPTELVVDVAGRVRRPGIAVLPAGSRVVDALEAAGGARRGVDLSTLNLARLVVDGEQILVGVPGSAAAPVGSGGPVPPAGSLVNINTAGQAELEELPEVGPVTAQAIIAWRDQHGGFTSVDQLLDVDGIGEATLNTLGPLVTV